MHNPRENRDSTKQPIVGLGLTARGFGGIFTSTSLHLICGGLEREPHGICASILAAVTSTIPYDMLCFPTRVLLFSLIPTFAGQREENSMSVGEMCGMRGIASWNAGGYSAKPWKFS